MIEAGTDGPFEVPYPDPGQVYELVKAALIEDGAFRDVTTQAIVPPDQQGRGTFVAREGGVLCGLTVAAAAFTALDDEIEVRSRAADGDWLHPGVAFASVVGPLGAILSAERVALNYLQRLSGIATATKAMVSAVGGLPVRILDTRKTTPGLRYLERYAVRVGGGSNHRFNLADGILIKDNHIAACRSRGLEIADVIRQARQQSPHTLKVEVEVTTLDEGREAIEAGADIVLLDNMSPALMAEVVAVARGRCLLEASGGVTLDNVREIAESGVDLISSGALTHSAKALDVSLEIETAEPE
ncbi:MAG TPA: carboxylating nicotinate-nucleotide diphosphorylase [Dehalococcoidia bacterium]|jgi:nicotinate-nucleotide pyrophosphorylase (carboxylating)